MLDNNPQNTWPNYKKRKKKSAKMKFQPQEMQIMIQMWLTNPFLYNLAGPLKIHTEEDIPCAIQSQRMEELYTSNPVTKMTEHEKTLIAWPDLEHEGISRLDTLSCHKQQDFTGLLTVNFNISSMQMTPKNSYNLYISCWQSIHLQGSTISGWKKSNGWQGRIRYRFNLQKVEVVGVRFLQAKYKDKNDPS